MGLETNANRASYESQPLNKRLCKMGHPIDQEMKKDCLRPLVFEILLHTVYLYVLTGEMYIKSGGSIMMLGAFGVIFWVHFPLRGKSP